MYYYNGFKRLREHKSAQCGVYNNGDAVEFWSYSTKVITILYKAGKRFIECTGTYSPTTRRQIGWFLREYAPDLNYYDVKNIVGRGSVAL